MKRKKIRRCWRLILSGILAMTLGASIPVQAAPSGVLKQAIHWGLSGDWLDPATNPGLISSQIILYLFHDALVKPMPQGNLSPSLAESWTISPDARVYEFKLRQGVEFHIISEPATRVAMVRRGEVDIATLMQGVFYEDVKKDPKLRLLHPLSPVTWIVYIGQQFDPKSPWADPRVRKAASLAIDRKSLADIFMPGCKPVGSMAMDGDPFGVPFPPDPYDPAQAKKHLAEAGYPKGLEGGEILPL
jgi:ABC-type transport system substrate-binding protein